MIYYSIHFHFQAFVATGTNLNLTFESNAWSERDEDRVVTREHVDFDREQGKVKWQNMQYSLWSWLEGERDKGKILSLTLLASISLVVKPEGVNTFTYVSAVPKFTWPIPSGGKCWAPPSQWRGLRHVKVESVKKFRSNNIFIT